MKVFRDYINEICDFYRQNGLKIDPVPKVHVDYSQADLYDPLISTGNYNPLTNTITLFVDNRQLKDILRSFCHELIHRNQHLEMGNRFDSLNKVGNLNENKELENIEGDAYRRGNLMFRKWTETYKSNNLGK